MGRKKKLIKNIKEVKKPEIQTSAEIQDAAPKLKAVKDTPQLVRGMKDLLPQDQAHFEFLRSALENLADNYGYERLDPPILEDVSLFIRGTGKYTDIVEKEMFTFVDQGGENLALRPEFTPSIARAYISHGMLNLPQPVRLCSAGPVFRHERPQHGRSRQFHQFNFDALGDAHPALDAEMMLIAHRFFENIGLKVSMQLNSIGCPNCREQYKVKLVDFYRSVRSKLCENCKKRLVRNPLRLLDCKEIGCVAVRAGAPQMLDALDEDCKNHFTRVLEYLDETGVVYSLNSYLVRGLDYYTKTVFEFWPEEGEVGAQDALGAGGRYDGLVEVLGGRPTPAIGFAVGIERIISRMKTLNVNPPPKPVKEIFLGQLGESARRRSFNLFNDLIKAGFHVSASFSKDSLKAQLEIANRLNVKITLILGQKEMLDNTIIVRDMDVGVQEIVDQAKLVNFLKRKLGKTDSLT